MLERSASMYKHIFKTVILAWKKGDRVKKFQNMCDVIKEWPLISLKIMVVPVAHFHVCLNIPSADLIYQVDWVWKKFETKRNYFDKNYLMILALGQFY